MSAPGTERFVRVAAVVIAVAAGIGALLLEGNREVGGNRDLEIILLMVGTITAGLISFDTAMDRRLQSFAPWVLVSAAPVLKTVPTVWAELRFESGLLVDRYDHAGSLLFGACIFGAIALLARPAPELGGSTSRFVAGVIGGSAITGALAGTSIAFLYDPNFGSPTAGRALETPTWFVLSGLLAAAAIAASHTRTLSVALTGTLAAGCATSALLAFSVAGRSVDTGWWIMLFAAFAASAALTDGKLGTKPGRDRQSNVAVVVALVVGIVAAASAISARSDRTAWSWGWALLGLVSLVMFGLAMASKPAEHATSSPGSSDDDARAQARAMQALRMDSSVDLVLAPQSSVEEFADQLDDGRQRRTAAAVLRAPAGEPGIVSGASSSAAVVTPAAVVAPAVASAATVEPAVVSGVGYGAVAPGAALPANMEPSPSPVQPVSRVANHQQAKSPSGFSDAGVVASAKAAAAVRDAPPPQRHSLAPLAQAHYFDPSTGLLSSAGLQHALARAFAVPRQAGHVTMLMFMIRDIDEIEQQHGRLASAAVTREVADRIASLLPQGTGARFARSAYAVVFVADMSNVAETAQWLARVLLQLRAPVEGGSLGDKIDVVAGMAQCYEREDVAQFVKRANQGLVRAAQMPEPTLVAMP